MNKLRSLLTQPAIVDAGVAISGNTIAAVLSGLALILISRALGPEEFGIISVGFSLMLIVAKLAEGGLNAVLLKYIPIAESVAHRGQLNWFALSIKCLLGIITAISLTVLSPWLASIFHVPAVLFITVGWFNLVTLLYDHLGAMLAALLRIRLAIIGNFFQASIKLILGIGVFFFGWLSAVGIFLLYMLAPAPAISFFWAKIPPLVRHKPEKILWQKYWVLTKSMAIHNWIAGLSTAVMQNSDIFVVSVLLPGLAVGYMGAAMRLTMFVALVGMSLAGVLNPRVARLSSAQQVSQYWRQATLLLVLSLIGAILLPLFANLLIYLSAGSDYVGAVPVMRWLLSAACLSIGVVGFGALFFRYHQPSFFSVMAIGQTVLIVVGTIWLIPMLGLVAVGMVRLVSQGLVLIITVVWAVLAHRQTFGCLPWQQVNPGQAR